MTEEDVERISNNLTNIVSYIFYYFTILLKIAILTFLIKLEVSFFEINIIETSKDIKGLTHSVIDIQNYNYFLSIIILVIICTLLFSIIANLLIIPNFINNIKEEENNNI